MNDWQDNHHHWQDRMTQSDNHLHEREMENLNNHLEEQKRVEDLLSSNRDIEIPEDEYFKNIQPQSGEDILENRRNTWQWNKYKYPPSSKISKIFSICVATFLFLWCFFGFFGHYFFGYN